MINKALKVGEIIKDNGKYLVQFPKGRIAFKTLKVAKQWQKLLLKGGSNV